MTPKSIISSRAPERHGINDTLRSGAVANSAEHTVRFSQEKLHAIEELMANSSDAALTPRSSHLRDLLREQPVNPGSGDRVAVRPTRTATPPRALLGELYRYSQSLVERARDAYRHEPERLSTALSTILKLAFTELVTAVQAIERGHGEIPRDPSSGLPSRAFLLQQIADALAHPELASGATAVVLIDLEAGSEHLVRRGATERMQLVLEAARRCHGCGLSTGWRTLGGKSLA